MAQGCVVVIGGTQGLGLEVARHYAGRGREVVLAGRDQRRAEAVAAEVGGKTSGLGLDLARPEELADRLAGVGCVHGFSNPAVRPVRWLETQAPQPQARHSYRFTRDWDYLRDALA